MRLTVPWPASPGVSWPEEGGGGAYCGGVGGVVVLLFVPFVIQERKKLLRSI